jgi:hypothetical protein
MNYETFPPHPDLEALVKCHWILEVPADADAQRQRIIPDGCLEMIFTLGDDIKRYTVGDEFIIQPRAMILGQTIEPFYIQPMGQVNTFAVRFYPYGFINFADTSLNNLANRETPLGLLFGEEPARELEGKIVHAKDTKERIAIAEGFLLNKLNERATIDHIVKATVDVLFSTRGKAVLNTILKDDLSKRRQLERKFQKQIGISAKQLGKVIRLQTALKLLLNRQSENLARIAYESEYYDQAHFIRDFKEFTGTNPGSFLHHDEMLLSSVFYAKD